ncbi:MAG: hypothetical protein WBA87_13090 [Microbacterium sp.]
MTDRNLALPADDDASEFAVHIGSSLLELVPGVGPTVARALDYKLARRKAARERQFQIYVVAAIKELWEERDSRPPIEDLFDSDMFVAAFERCSRAAAETASETKRARLARAAASAVFAGSLRESETETFIELAARYSDLHVWLLSFYCDPAGWLEANGMESAASPGIRGGKRDEPVQAALKLGPRNMAIVQAAIEDLQRDMMLAVFDLDESVGDRKQFAPQTRRRARRFLRFLREADTTAPAPSLR